MGHDTTAYRCDGGEKVAYLRRSMHCQERHNIYHALNRPEYDAGVSGGGHEEAFDRTELQTALEILPKVDTEARRFLHDCLAWIDEGHDTVFIEFY